MDFVITSRSGAVSDWPHVDSAKFQWRAPIVAHVRMRSFLKSICREQYRLYDCLGENPGSKKSGPGVLQFVLRALNLLKPSQLIRQEFNHECHPQVALDSIGRLALLLSNVWRGSRTNGCPHWDLR